MSKKPSSFRSGVNIRNIRSEYASQLTAQEEPAAFIETENEDDFTGNMDRRWYLFGAGFIILSLFFRLPLLLVIGLLLLFVVGMTDIWESYCLRHVRYRRTFSEQRVLFGEQVTLSQSIENAKLLPLPWVEVEDNIPRALPLVGRNVRVNILGDTSYLNSLFSLRWYERITRSYTIQCNVRGVHKFGPTKMQSGDVFGFFSNERAYPSLDYLLVYPLVVPLTRFGLPSRYPFGEKRAHRRLLEDPSRVIGVRDYLYGDSLRRVHWKATARTLQLQSKVYDATTTYTLVMFLNVSANFEGTYGLLPELYELSICVAASISDWAINEGYAVGLYANTLMYAPEDRGYTLPEQSHNADTPASASEQHSARDFADEIERRRIHIPPASNENQRQRIMETLARIQPYFGTTIEEIIQKERSRLPAGATIIVITSTLSDQLLDTLSHIQQVGHAVTILFVGDTPFPNRFSGLTLYHLGGQHLWKELEAAYSNTSTNTNGEPRPVDNALGFRL